MLFTIGPFPIKLLSIFPKVFTLSTFFIVYECSHIITSIRICVGTIDHKITLKLTHELSVIRPRICSSSFNLAMNPLALITDFLIMIDDFSFAMPSSIKETTVVLPEFRLSFNSCAIYTRERPVTLYKITIDFGVFSRPLRSAINPLTIECVAVI